MGHQIIQQPDGLFCVFSTVTDSIITYDATEEKLMYYYANRAAQEAVRLTRDILENVKAGTPERFYHQFALTFEDANRIHEGTDEKIPYGYISPEGS